MGRRRRGRNLAGHKPPLEAQRLDGGWAQIQTRESDAYATGETLVDLSQAGRGSPSDAAFRRGISFLLKTQQPDGSWEAQTRRTRGKRAPFVDSGFSYGMNQFISFAATNIKLSVMWS
jgi:hypothetical protein